MIKPITGTPDLSPRIIADQVAFELIDIVKTQEKAINMLIEEHNGILEAYLVGDSGASGAMLEKIAQKEQDPNEA